jgi:high-affinity iron transporter
MLSAYVLSLREGLEAALVVGVVLSALRKLGRRELNAPVWSGAGLAGLLSLVAAVLLTYLGLELKDPAEAIFEAITMLLAGGLLTWMIFWMGRHAGAFQASLQSGVQRASLGGKGSLFWLAFLSVLREGVELALFLTAAAFSSSAVQTVTGALLGLGTAFLLGWGLFASSVRLNLKHFFTVTGILLVFFAAGLVVRSIHEFNELGWVPAIVAPVWNLSGVLSDQSLFGQILATLFGYTASPSLTEVLAYGMYIAVVLFGLIWVLRRSGRSAQPQG